jgi:hypothetical protein
VDGKTVGGGADAGETLGGTAVGRGLAVATMVALADGWTDPGPVASGVGDGLRTGELMHADTVLATSSTARTVDLGLTRIGRPSASHV